MLIMFDSKLKTKTARIIKGSVDLVKQVAGQLELRGKVKTTYADDFDPFIHRIPGQPILKFVDKPQRLWYYDEQYDGYVIEAYNPRKVIRWAEGFPELYYAFLKLKDFDYYKKLASSVQDVDYEIVNDLSDPTVQEKLNKADFLACDIETRGFNWSNDPMLIHGFCYETAKTLIVPQKILDESPKQKLLFKQLVEDKSKTFVWQNGKFDTKFYRFAGWDARVDEDIMLQSYSLDERGGIHGLEPQAEKLLNVPKFKGKVDFETVAWDDPDFLKYLAKDCAYTREIHKHHNLTLADNPDSKKLYYETLLPAGTPLRHLEEDGFYVNVPYAEKLDDQYTKMIVDEKKVLDDIAKEVGFDGKEYCLATGAKKAPTVFSPTSPKQLGYVILTLLGLPKHKNRTSTDAQAMLFWLLSELNFPAEDEFGIDAAPDEVVQEWIGTDIRKKFLWALKHFRKVKKMHSTYILNAITKRWDDDRVHANFKLHGTVTGRLASGDPMNLQNIPRQKDIKKLFSVPKGKVLIECDYSQAELRILAFLSQDPTLLLTYREGKDLHSEVAAKVFGADFTKEQRTAAKMINFGLAYGRGVGSLAEQLGCRRDEAQSFIDAWFAGMPVAAKYITEMREKPIKGERIVTPFGRERRFWLTNNKNNHTHKNEAINFPIQSTASDCTLHSLIAIDKFLIANKLKYPEVKLVNTVHDAVLLEVPEAQVEEMVTAVTTIMEQVPADLLNLNVPLVADAECALDGWGAKMDYVDWLKMYKEAQQC